MDMAAGYSPARIDHELNGDQLAGGVGGVFAKMNRSPLTGLSRTCPT